MAMNHRDDLWRVSLATFAEVAGRGAWRPYKWLRYVARRIEEALRRGGARLIICAPPRHGKSELVAHWLPTYWLDWHPEERIIVASYADSLATTWGRAVRTELQTNPLLRTRVRPDDERANDWRTLEGGGMRTAGVGAGLTGFGASLVICDDVLKDWEEAKSPVVRDAVVNWFHSVLTTRLEPGGSAIVMGTRWHEADLMGHLLQEQGDAWEAIVLPAVAEDEDPMGRGVGEPLCPERFDARRLEVIRATTPERTWASLYQQRPAPPEGAIIRREWLRHYAEPPRCPSVILSADLTFQVTSSGSYCVVQVWGQEGANFYLLDQVRDRLDFNDQIAVIADLQAKWRAQATLIERKANGAAALAMLAGKVPGLLPVEPQGSKEIRAEAVSPLFEAGNVWLPPAELPWVRDLVDELTTFPAARNDDQVDAASQALAWLHERSAGAYHLEHGGYTRVPMVHNSRNPNSALAADDDDAAWTGEADTDTLEGQLRARRFRRGPI
jgi:predicted phage terminase large subunit-like protein